MTESYGERLRFSVSCDRFFAPAESEDLLSFTPAAMLINFSLSTFLC